MKNEMETKKDAYFANELVLSKRRMWSLLSATHLEKN